MPKTDRLNGLRDEIESIAGAGSVTASPADLALYCYDAGISRGRPEAVIKITETRQVAAVVKILCKNKIPYLPRAAGTNVSGGCVPLKTGAVLDLAALNRIIEIDTAKNYALVEAGVTNAALQNELGKLGDFFAPDPASAGACTLGGNIAEKAAGPRSLKYGAADSQLLAADIVTPEGETVHWSETDGGPDLLGLFAGSEGTLGIATRLWLKIIKNPTCIKTVLACFPSLEQAAAAAAETMAKGLLPRAMELLDNHILRHTGRPDWQAALLIETDGEPEEAAREIENITAVCRGHGMLDMAQAQTSKERDALWRHWRRISSALAKAAPNLITMDGVVPLPNLPQAVKEAKAIAEKHGVRLSLAAHAGDGHLHPNIMFDIRNKFETNLAKQASRELMAFFARSGGAISGSYGVGLEKRVAMSWLYEQQELDVMRCVKRALDPENLANPDKIIPVSGSGFGEQKVFLRPQKFKLSAAAEKLVQSVKDNAAAKKSALVTGLGTKLNRGGLNAPGTVLSLKNLNRVLDLNRGNLTATIEAGISIAELKKHLALEKLYAALPDSAGTLGGMIAAKSCPAASRIILGMQILLPDGATASFGGETARRCCGYEITKLFAGSRGAYGIILNVTLRLSTRPEKLSEQPNLAPFTPNSYHAGLKRALDPDNLFNPWIFAGRL